MDKSKQPDENPGLKANNKEPPLPRTDTLHALVVDDEFANRDFMVRLLQQTQIKVRGAGTAEQALAIIEELGTQIVLVMLDHQLPDKSGIELLKDIREKLPEAKILMATMHDERSMMREAFALGCTGFMVKPHGFMELYKTIKNVVEDPSVLEQLDNLIFDTHGTRPWRG
jgi:DNA-binding NtrC family response regulator